MNDKGVCKIAPATPGLLKIYMHYRVKVGHLHPFYLCLSRLACSLDELQDVGLTNFVRPNILKTNPCIYLWTGYGTSMDRIWNYSCQNLTCIYLIINPVPHLLDRTTPERCLPSGWICWQKKTWKKKTPGGILVFRVLVQICTGWAIGLFCMSPCVPDIFCPQNC